MTLEEARSRVATLNTVLHNNAAPAQKRREFMAEKLRLEQGLAAGSFAKGGRAKIKVALFVDDYVGPRCQFCSGPKPNPAGPCLNASPDWPHPPELRA